MLGSFPDLMALAMACPQLDWQGTKGDWRQAWPLNVRQVTYRRTILGQFYSI